MTLPNYTRQIKDFEDYIGVYSGEFFFKLPKKNWKTACYIFVDCSEK